MTTLVFPVGHYLGEFASDGEFGGGHQIRVGQDSVSLSDGEFASWAMAHEESAPSPALEKLGVLVSVDPQKAQQFARQYRLRPLLTALGRSGGNVALGFGTQVTVVVDEQTHELWWWAGPSQSLWALCERASASSPEAVLEHFLEHGRTLLGGGAAYLDLVPPK